jgi:hypothetical protein
VWWSVKNSPPPKLMYCILILSSRFAGGGPAESGDGVVL